jgi:hypothetical protein
MFDLAKSSLSAAFIRVIKALNSLAPRVIKWPEGERLNNIIRRFHAIAGLDNVIGAIDLNASKAVSFLVEGGTDTFRSSESR